AFLEFRDKTFVERAADTLSNVCGEVKIVINENQRAKFETAFPDFDFVCDIYRERGAPGGIHAALKNCETQFAVVLAVDLPFVTNAAIENLARVTLDSNKFIAFVPEQSDGKAQPLCAVYLAKFCLPKLENLLEENETASVTDFLELISPKYVAQNLLSEDENLILNVNYPQDCR